MNGQRFNVVIGSSKRQIVVKEIYGKLSLSHFPCTSRKLEQRFNAAVKNFKTHSNTFERFFFKKNN